MIGKNGLVLSRLVFETIFSFPINNKGLRTQTTRMKKLATTHAEMNTIVDERRNQFALTEEIPTEADRH